MSSVATQPAKNEPSAEVAAEAAAFRPDFSHLALLVQVPGVDVVGRVVASPIGCGLAIELSS